jgi:hypothetical protein
LGWFRSLFSGLQTYYWLMTPRSIRSRAIAFVLAALILGFAPLVHAMCVGQTHNASASHMMADGSIMFMPEAGSAPLSNASPIVSEAKVIGLTAEAGGPTGDLTLLGLIALSLAPACLVLLGLRLMRRVNRDSLQVAVRIKAASWRPPPIFHRPTMVDLLSLGISRT